MDWRIAAYAVPGRRDNGLSDAFAYRMEGERVWMAVADGVGSMKESGKGARFVVHAAVEILPHVSSLKEAVKETRAKLLAFSTEQNIPFHELSSTLILSRVTPEGVEVAHLGDGGVVAKVDKSWIVLSPPEEGEYANEVVPLTSPDWGAHLRVTHHQPVQALALFTDGCQRGVLERRPNAWIPAPKFWNPFFEALQESEDPIEVLRYVLEDLFEGYTDDDRTLLCVWRSQ